MRLSRLIPAVIAGVVLTAASADAGPLLNRLRARGGSCGSCQQQPATAFQAAPAVPATAPVVTTSTCPGGVCPAPATVRRGVFR